MRKAKAKTMPGKKPPGDGAAREREASRSHSNVFVRAKPSFMWDEEVL